MNRMGPFLFLVVFLFVAGIATAMFRHNELGLPFSPGAQQSVWQIEARIQYDADDTASQVKLTLPPEQSGYRIVSETTASSGFGYNVETQDQRRAVWSKRDASGDQFLFYKLELVRDPEFTAPAPAPAEIESRLWIEPFETAARQLIDTLLPLSADGKSLALQIISAMNTQPLDQNLSLLLDQYPADALLSDLLQMAEVPARKVQVLELEDARRRQNLRGYVQVWDSQSSNWLLLDPIAGIPERGQELYLWQTDTPSVLEVIGGSNSRVTFAMINQTRSALAVAQQNSDEFRLSLYSLPIAEQSMFKLIMLMPVGALVVVFLRLVIGIKTSGTFMPILIALAFLQTELIPGVISLLLVVAFGLLLRSYLSALNLLLVSRIATLVILVIGIITVVSVVSYELGLIGGLTISFFPMIILAWTIERMSILWEEDGPREVLIQGGGSLMVSIAAYALMDLQIVRHLVFNFPELHLCVLAIIMLLGRYTGYRLMELLRFADYKAVTPKP
ncbi:MAG: inactive transglutaminase family protein [Pseudomonadales bacterium]